MANPLGHRNAFLFPTVALDKAFSNGTAVALLQCCLTLEFIGKSDDSAGIHRHTHTHNRG